jgi:hypothetical protein
MVIPKSKIKPRLFIASFISFISRRDFAAARSLDNVNFNMRWRGAPGHGRRMTSAIALMALSHRRSTL